MDKSRKKITQDYARNAIVDGNTSAGRYERSMAIKEASGQGPSMRSPVKNLKGAGGGLVSSTEAKPYMKDEGGPYMMGGGSWMSKHSQSKMSPLGNYDTAKGSHGHPHPDAPLKMENVIDRDAKSSGPDQYDKYGK